MSNDAVIPMRRTPGKLPDQHRMLCKPCNQHWLGSPGGRCPICWSALIVDDPPATERGT